MSKRQDFEDMMREIDGEPDKGRGYSTGKAGKPDGDLSFQEPPHSDTYEMEESGGSLAEDKGRASGFAAENMEFAPFSGDDSLYENDDYIPDSEKQAFSPITGRFQVVIDDEGYQSKEPGQVPPMRNRSSQPRSGGRESRKWEIIRTSTRWARALIMLAAALGLSVFLAIFALTGASDLFGLNQKDQEIVVVIPENATKGEIAKILKDAGVIEQSFVFNMYAGLKVKQADQFKGGKYELNSNLSYDEIIIALKLGVRRPEVRITFPEGKTLQEIAEILEEKSVCDADEFIEYLQTADLNYQFINMMPEDPLRFRRLEGYIFPDTYEFYEQEKVASVAAKFLDNFDARITDSMYDKAREFNMSIDDVIILASIIQKESGYVEDMDMVSSVFHNRLNQAAGYPNLQSDVTIYYVEEDIKPNLDISNQAIYDAYNTYVCEGLPVGAVCNPGLEAIQAALSPAMSDYYFFVTDSEGTYYYAKTADEHYVNIKKAEGVGGEAHGIDTMEAYY